MVSIGLFCSAILFLATGRLNWTWAWVFLGIYLVSISINSAFMLRTSAEPIAERGQPKEMKEYAKSATASFPAFGEERHG
jgi:hypothetical protein